MRRDAGRIVDIMLLLLFLMMILLVTIMNMLELVGKHTI